MIEVYKCPKDLWAQYVENLDTFKQDAEQNEVAIQQLPAIQKPVLLCKIKPPANLLKTQSKNTPQNYSWEVMIKLEILKYILLSGELSEYISSLEALRGDTSRSDWNRYQ